MTMPYLVGSGQDLNANWERPVLEHSPHLLGHYCHDANRLGTYLGALQVGHVVHIFKDDRMDPARKGLVNLCL